MKRWSCDFETTTDPEDCRIWAFGYCAIDNYNLFGYGNSFDDFMLFCKNHVGDTLYFHNLKFDGEFIVNNLFKLGYKHVKDKKLCKPETFTTLITDMSVWFSMFICFGYDSNGRPKGVTINDSLKIIPLPVKEIPKAFGLDILKGEINYMKFRPIGHYITKRELKYLKHDVQIVAQAMNFMLNHGMTKITQASNAMQEYKKIVSKNFKRWFPVLDKETDMDIRTTYKGGYVYTKESIKGKDIQDGIVLDVNSLFPSRMYEKPLPYGMPVAFEGKYIYDEAYPLYTQVIRCQFTLKEGYLPTIQLKNNLAFNPVEYIKDSGDEEIVMHLTCIDLELFLEHYHVYNLEYIRGYKFQQSTGLFKEYIDKWYAIKEQATIEGNKGMRQIAKLMLNSLYGKFGLRPYVASKYPVFDDGFVRYKTTDYEDRKPIYIPVASFITAWARDKTIRSAQACYDRFLYSDTDSLHLTGKELPENLDIDDTKLGYWAHESSFTRARFVQSKRYIEEINGELNIKCCGMPDGCYKYVTWENFHIGTEYTGKLTQSRVKGGAVLKETTFKMR